MPEMLTPANLWTAWNTTPSLLISLAAMVLLYTRGLWKAGRRRRHGGVDTPSQPPPNGPTRPRSIPVPSAQLGEAVSPRRAPGPNGVPAVGPRSAVGASEASGDPASALQRSGAEGTGRRGLPRQVIRKHTSLPPAPAFAAAVLVLLVALVSPLDALSETLFAAHMVQHLLLMLAAAPLLVLGELPVALLRALPRAWAQALVRLVNRSRPLRRTWQALALPAVAGLLFAVELWAWHSSALYQAALRSESLHTLEHLSLLLSAMLFWWVLLKHSTAKHVQYGIATAYLFGASIQSGVLGALMIFTSVPWYAYYAARVGAWGLTPLQDQQLAGLIMWIPGGAVFNVLTVAYFAAWLRALDERHRPLREKQELYR